jgi:hypothetical protein
MTLVINGAALIFLGGQVALARRQLRYAQQVTAAEDARRRSQATIDFYMATIDKVIRWREDLPNDWDSAAIERLITEAYETNDDRRQRQIAVYLGFFETLAVAVRHGVYDLNVIDDIAGSRLLNISSNYETFFKRRRIQVGAQTAYENLVWLGKELATLPSRRTPS